MTRLKGKQVEVEYTSQVNYPTPSTYNVDKVFEAVDQGFGQRFATSRIADFIQIEHREAPGVDAGTATQGAWRTRTANTLVVDTTGEVTLSSNQITLPPGTYVVWIQQRFHLTSVVTGRLQDVDNGVTLLTGMVSQSSNNLHMTSAMIIGRFTINVTTTVEIQYTVGSTQTTTGQGQDGNTSYAAVGTGTVDHETYLIALFGRQGDGASETQTVNEYALIQHQENNDVAGGTFTAGDWRTRPLNTIVSNVGNIVSLSGNQMTVSPGRYLVRAWASCYLVSNHATRLQNITDGTTIVNGESGFAQTAASGDGGDQNKSHLVGVFVLDATKVLEFQHRCSSTKASSGFGIGSAFNFPVDKEVYATVELIKLPDNAGIDVAYQRGYIDGFNMSNAADALHDITISTGAATDSTNCKDMRLFAALTKQIDAPWAEGSDAGGFPTGITLSPNTWYHVFIIVRETGVNVDAGFDTSLVAANLLADAPLYKKFRRIGSILTDASSNIIGFSQRGDHFLWDAAVQDVNTSTTGSASLKTLSVPTGVVVEADLLTAINATNNTLRISSPDTDDQAAGLEAQAGSDANLTSGDGRVRTNTSGQVRERTNTAAGNIRILTVGWYDARGKDA